MDKQKEIEKMEFIIGSTIRECEQKDCIRNCEFARRKDCKYCRAAKDLVNSGYGDTKAAIKEFAEKAIAMGRITFAPNNGKEYLEIALEKFENLVKEICENEI